ncbi:MAG: hypothetical protein ACRC62_31925 [Microcoleus sp.]
MKKLLTATIIFFSTAIPCWAMTSDRLVEFARRYRRYNDKLPVAYSYYDKTCNMNVSVSLVKTVDLGKGRIGGITSQFLCWGGNYTYFEMTRGDLQSIKAVAEVGAGRSTNYTNWEAVSNPGDDLTEDMLVSVAKAISRHTK